MIQLDDTQCKTLDDLFAEIGIGNRAAPLVIYQLILVMQKIDHAPGKKVAMTEYPLMINGTEATQYTFQQDYYWAMGDNQHNSEDSRVWGFVPFDHIVGKPLFIWMSAENGIRWNRIFSSANKM